MRGVMSCAGPGSLLSLLTLAPAHSPNAESHRSSSPSFEGEAPSTLFSSWFPILARLSLLLLYLYSCDRGGIFMKENKWYTHFNFFLPTLYVMVLGLFFTEGTRNTEVLNAEQRDEWRGWMQLVILVYHMTGAESVVPIRLFVHTLTSAHLFLLGYSHFDYVFHTGDFSLTRLFRVLLRYNLLAGILCLALDRAYLYYPYIPVATYWFVFCFLTLAAPPQITLASSRANPMHYLYMVIKLVAFFTVISVLYLSEAFFERVFSLWVWGGLWNSEGTKALTTATNGNLSAWWFRWWTHRYSAGLGMVVGLCLAWAREKGLLADGEACGTLFSRRLSGAASFLALAGLVGWTVLALTCGKEEECMELQGFLAWAPIVGYAVLRNVAGGVRSRLSYFWAWWGALSTELWVLSREAWLSADGAGVLVLWPRWPVLNLITTSALLLLAAHESRLLAHSLIHLLLPHKKPATVIRNLLIAPLIFIFVLLAKSHLLSAPVFYKQYAV